MLQSRGCWCVYGAILSVATACAQSTDALLNKLVEKGILTTKEATELRPEADQNFNEAYKVKTGLPDWVNQLKLYGDFRGRVEMFHFDNDAPGALEPNKDRTRYRYRLRVGLTAIFKDNFETGFRLTSSEPVGNFGGDPLGGNTTQQANASKKFCYLDLAYGKWTPLKTGPWLLSGTVGKMENPFVVSDMIFDTDYIPEGAAIQGGYTINKVHSLKLNTGAFVIQEFNQNAIGAGQASRDPSLLGAQLRHDAKWTPKVSSALSLTWYDLLNAEGLANGTVPNVNVGNTRYAVSPPLGHRLLGGLVYDYEPIVVGASATYTLDSVPGYKGAFPIMILGEFMNNFGAPENNQGWWAGVTFGKAGKKGTWEVSYRYKYLEADAWYEEFVDADFGAYYQPPSLPASAGRAPLTGGYYGGTGTKGNIVKAVYSFTDGFSVSMAFFLTDLIDTSTIIVDGKAYKNSHTRRMQIDANWKF